MTFDLYQYPRLGSYMGRDILVIGLIVDNTQNWGPTLRLIVADCDEDGASTAPMRVMTDYESKDVRLQGAW